MQKWIEELPVRPVTKLLIWCLTLKLFFPPSVQASFGADSRDNFLALKAVLFDGETRLDEIRTSEQISSALHERIIALDEALGSRTKLNALVQKYAPHFAEFGQFTGLRG